ncbi:ATP-binding protein [Limnohabitans sp. Rim8]|uniref:sensor histidine kinase n=1 Tax=Limnohabitans sp. Rim8 TaxID=1100718 RepID=UPI00260D8F57|nr:ATP-binding protein [Limnohabitans sp. Rim8]
MAFQNFRFWRSSEQAIRLIATVVRCGLLWLLLFWQLPGLAQPVEAARDSIDHISARAWLDDPSNSLGPEQVRSMAWTPFTGPLRRGFLASTTWVRLTIEPPADQGHGVEQRQSRLVLRMQPGQVDEIALFDPRHPEQAPQLAGDMHDWRLSEYRSFNQNLLIAAPSEQLEVYLRLRTESHHGIQVEALRWEDAQAKDQQQQLIFGGAIVFLLMILGWAVWAWIDHRERVLTVFIIHQVASLFFALSLLGFFRVYLSQWFSAPVISGLTSAFFPIGTTAVLWFHWHFLREFKPPRLGLVILKWLAIATPLTLLMMLGGLMRQALQIISALSALYPFLLLLLALLVPRPLPGGSPRLSRGRLILIYCILLIVINVAALSALGLTTVANWMIYSALIYGLLSAALLANAMIARTKHDKTARLLMQTELALNENMMRQEQNMRMEQEKFMTMLTHELTNALATAHLAIGSLDPASAMRARGYRAIDSMRAIIRRCSLSSELEADALALQHSPVNLQDLLQEMCSQMPADANILLNTAADLPDCKTDRQLLRVILSNLLDNAINYRAPASAIEVSASLQSRGLVAGMQMSVSNAPGEAGAPDPQQVFKKFWRGPGATRCAGSGMGLYLSSMIAQRLSGELRYQPENPNVRFELWLPI